MYNIKSITELEYNIRNHFLNTIKIKGYYEPYQSYPPLNIKGQRPTGVRVGNYGILDLISDKFDILDVGGNVGFLSMYLSKNVKNIDIIEFDKGAFEIGEMLKKHEKIDNVNFYNVDFKKFKTNKKYDMVMSYAVHWWVGMNINDYFQSIYNLLKNNGIFIIESHYINPGLNKNDDSELKNQILNYGKFSIIKESISDDDKHGTLRSFYICRKI